MGAAQCSKNCECGGDPAEVAPSPRPCGDEVNIRPPAKDASCRISVSTSKALKPIPELGLAVDEVLNTPNEEKAVGSREASKAPVLTREKSRMIRAAADHLTVVYAEDVCSETLHKTLAELAARDPDATEMGPTLLKCAELLEEGVGGCIIAVIHEDILKHKLKFSYLDEGVHTEFFREVGKLIHDETGALQKAVAALTAHCASDRWEQQELEDLVQELPAAADFVGQLLGQPKDGAILLSHVGTVKGAAMHLKYPSARLQLVKSNNTAAGTRHASALGFAEWLGSTCSYCRCPGVVFARSDAGGAHAFIPQAEGPPVVLHFRTQSIPGQEDMLELFRERIMKTGCCMRKAQPVIAREGLRGERVVTVVAGRVTSEMIIEDDTSMVCQASTADQEHYTLTREKFGKAYEVPGMDLDKQDDLTKVSKALRAQVHQLVSRGFKIYKPRLDDHRWVYNVTDEDLSLVPTGCFKASWGAIQPLKIGDCLAMPAAEGEATEIYLMPAVVLSNYVEVRGDRGSRSDARPLTQADMRKLFKTRILTAGTLMYRAEAQPMRPARRGEHIVTCIGGAVVATCTVQDDASVVVRGSLHHELYVLPRETFEANWETTGKDISSRTPLKRLLQSQGFRMHKPKIGAARWVHMLQASDLKLIPSGCFETPWGSTQSVQEGDFLAMSSPEAPAPEIYMMSSDTVTMYADRPMTSRKSLSGHLLHRWK